MHVNFRLNGESKVLQYFGNMRNNLATPDDFAEVIEITNHPELWDAKLTWYLLSANCRICFFWDTTSESTTLGIPDYAWSLIAQSAGTVEYTDCTSEEG